MLKSPTLVAQVLERRHLSYFIGPEGLRELEPLSESHIFALGDSFVVRLRHRRRKDLDRLARQVDGRADLQPWCLCYGTQAATRALQIPARDACVHDARPASALDDFRGQRSRELVRQTSHDAPPAATSLFQGTIVEPFLSIPERVKGASVLRRLVRGQLALSSSGPRYGQYEIDGQALPLPLFHSNQFGYRFFVPADVDAATTPDGLRPESSQSPAARSDVSGDADAQSERALRRDRHHCPVGRAALWPRVRGISDAIRQTAFRGLRCRTVRSTWASQS